MTKRRRFSDTFKATVAFEAFRGDRTVQEIAAKHQVHPTQVTTWKRQAIDGLTGVFSDKVKRAANNERGMSRTKRKEIINKDRPNLSLTRQCKLLKIGRSSLYYAPVGLMRKHWN